MHLGIGISPPANSKGSVSSTPLAYGTDTHSPYRTAVDKRVSRTKSCYIIASWLKQRLDIDRYEEGDAVKLLWVIIERHHAM